MHDLSVSKTRPSQGLDRKLAANSETRARHIKCDEVSPICQQCRRAKRECLRYSMGAPPLQISTAVVVPTAMELSLNHFFRTLVVHVGVDEFNDDITRHQILQAAHNLPSIWHASNAVAASWWLNSGVDRPTNDYAARLRNEIDAQELASTRYLLPIAWSSIMSEEQKTTILLTNLLLVMHVRSNESAVKFMDVQATSFGLIRYWRFWESINSSPVAALATQALFCWVKIARGLRECLLTTSYQPGDDWHEAIACLQGWPLSTPMRAWIEIDMIWATTRSLLEGFSFQPRRQEIEAVQAKRSALYHHFIQWGARIDALSAHTLARDSIQFTALHARRILTAILFKLDLGKFEGLWDETCWDGCTNDFAAAVNCIASVQNKSASWYGRELHVTGSISSSLHFIARFCRDPIIRRTALETMRAGMFTAVGSFSGDVGEEEKKQMTSNFLIDDIIAHEEMAWAYCTETPACRRGTFICNAHRVAAIYAKELCIMRYEFTCFTVGDLLRGGTGQKWIRAAPICACSSRSAWRGDKRQRIAPSATG
ncbi:hypothetical protein NLG97_g8665 [Lecanicillium saksenae]|uniref:Uncharacterized protein n=1 Tax=Lecanicillium saksenae TaxID=468837 RepID=A0ACC1QJH4_9HYPO|nr:hypothetical protein NLG97_g8665 [Lecanicillium saksenae]